MASDVWTVGPSQSLLEAAEIMRRRRVSGLPVVDRHGVVVGVLSERDIVRDLLRGWRPRGSRHLLDLLLAGFGQAPAAAIDEGRRQLERRPVAGSMSRPAVTVGPDATLSEIGRAMHRYRVNRLPVVENGRLVGIVTRQDLVDALDPERRAARRPPRSGPGSRPRGADRGSRL